MGRRGGPSRGCAICRHRKIKCDEASPNCMRCVTSGRQCTGPLTDVFVFDMTRVIQLSSRASRSFPPTEHNSRFQNPSKSKASNKLSKPTMFRKWRHTPTGPPTSVSHNGKFQFVNQIATCSDVDSLAGEDSWEPQIINRQLPQPAGHLHNSDEFKLDGSIYGTDINETTPPPHPIQCSTLITDHQVQTSSLSKPRLFGNAAKLDPFDTLAIRLSQKDEMLVDNFENLCGYYYGYKSFPLLRNKSNLYSYKLPLVYSTRPVFHAALALAAAHQVHLLASRSNNDSSYSSIARDSRALALSHGAEACRLMNRRLESNDEVFTDTSICTIFYLLLAERMAGTIDQANIHMSGLSQIMNLRGGLQMVPLMMAAIINSVDVVLSLERLEQPAFPLYDLSQVSPEYTLQHKRWSVALRNRPLGAGFLRLNLLEILPDELLDIILEVNVLASEFDLISQTVTDPNELGFFEYRCLAVQHALLTYDYKSLPNAFLFDQDPVATIRGLCRLTTLMFFAIGVTTFCTWVRSKVIRYPQSTVETRFPAMTPESAQFAEAVSFIHSTLPKAFNTSDILEYSDIFLWILFFAGFLARDGERQFFVVHIKCLAGVLGLRNFEQVKERLTMFLYRESVFDSGFRDLWGEVLASAI